MRKRIWLGAALALAAGIAGAVWFFDGGRTGAASPARSYEELTGSRFLAVPDDPLRPPRVRELALPAFNSAQSIWGAFGRDFRGHIWVGVSAADPGMSAHLLEYDPAAERWQDHGAVVDQLKAAKVHRNGEGQVKIHSRIVPAQDGWLYFASSDEEGESVQGSVPPRWGGHLWRIHPEHRTWQHLLAVPEGLVAVSGVGRYIYALGYWGHVLYQYDTASGKTRRAEVGSVAGHVSRNLLSDLRGHAYVPRLSAKPGGGVSAALVEYDEALQEVGATPLEFYLGKEAPSSNHGIVGLAYLPDGRMVFATHPGHLYVIEPKGGGPATVAAAGWFHPEGQAYTPSLFPFGGRNWIAGVARRPSGFEWVVSEMGSRSSAAFALDTKNLNKVLLYGSIARDDAGRAYVGGWAAGPTGGQRPLLLQLDPGS